ncbi:AsnC family transcriptional regulator [Haladaptatus sp. W1]|uniref:Lrp/AsnC family transcriptional regulator n=1 Tax=Haladaptatus sp. W1 TaxID=1897478 RepID=UPI000849DACB|nr:Lrp/AsnC family transcriptional regulator [Haladaptatus sp. W1]ODR83263.1 AsnC family transcriptional regulator [Haladaptatus sp. W1]
MSETEESSVKLDEMDLALLERVETDFDVSLEELAGELDLSKSAVHYRLNKLKDSGVIEGVTADLNPLSFDLEMVAITDVSVTHEQGYSETIGEQLATIDGVEQVYYTMGDTDFVVISRVQDRDQMNDLIDEMVAIEGINETSSKFVMQEIENGRKIVGNMSDRVVESIIG